MAKKKLTEQEEKEIKILQATNEMYTKTLNDVKLRGDEDVIRRVELAKADVEQQIKNIDSSLTGCFGNPLILLPQEINCVSNSLLYSGSRSLSCRNCSTKS